MSSEKIEIVPYPVDRSIAYLKLFVDNFQLNAIDCWVSVYEYDASDHLLNVQRCFIEPAEYQDWGTVDDYLVDLVLDKLGYERKPDAPIIVPDLPL